MASFSDCREFELEFESGIWRLILACARRETSDRRGERNARLIKIDNSAHELKLSTSQLFNFPTPQLPNSPTSHLDDYGIAR